MFGDPTELAMLGKATTVTAHENWMNDMKGEDAVEV